MSLGTVVEIQEIVTMREEDKEQRRGKVLATWLQEHVVTYSGQKMLLLPSSVLCRIRWMKAYHEDSDLDMDEGNTDEDFDPSDAQLLGAVRAKTCGSSLQ